MAPTRRLLAAWLVLARELARARALGPALGPKRVVPHKSPNEANASRAAKHALRNARNGWCTPTPTTLRNKSLTKRPTARVRVFKGAAPLLVTPLLFGVFGSAGDEYVAESSDDDDDDEDIALLPSSSDEDGAPPLPAPQSVHADGTQVVCVADPVEPTPPPTPVMQKRPAKVTPSRKTPSAAMSPSPSLNSKVRAAHVTCLPPPCLTCGFVQPPAGFEEHTHRKLKWLTTERRDACVVFIA